jgi:hypothetical protein
MATWSYCPQVRLRLQEPRRQPQPLTIQLLNLEAINMAAAETEIITAYTTITIINIIIHANLFHINKLLAIPATTPPGGTIIEDHRP